MDHLHWDTWYIGMNSVFVVDSIPQCPRRMFVLFIQKDLFLPTGSRPCFVSMRKMILEGPVETEGSDGQ